MVATLGREASEAIQHAGLCNEVPLLIWQASSDGLLDYFNERVHEYSGATYKQLSGAGWLRLVHPEDRERVVHRWAYSLATRVPYEIEFRIRKHDKSYRWFLTQAKSTTSSDTGRLRWVGACTEVQRYANQQQLERVARIATASEASRDTAHLLNQPLTATLSNAQALQRMLNGPAQLSELQETVADIVGEVRRAIQILRNWGVTLQEDAPQFILVHINRVVRDAAALLLGDLVASQCALDLQLSRRSPRVRIDAGQMQYALAMLIMTACEMMKHRAAEARRIRVRTMHPSVRCVHIEVAHSGPVVRTDDLKVLEPRQMTMLHGSGLAICKRIVEAHDGRLDFSTDPAHPGSVYRIELPVAS